jgi:hypothetical protein
MAGIIRGKQMETNPNSTFPPACPPLESNGGLNLFDLLEPGMQPRPKCL